MALHPMSPIDAAWYHMDGPVNLAVVTGLVLTREPLDFEAVRALYQQRITTFDHFHQRVVNRGIAIATPHWQDMEPFDIDCHIHHIALPAPYDAQALRNLISDISSTDLNHDLPLWQVHVVDDVEGGSALIMRYHHCIGDGNAMMTVARRLFDTQPTSATDDPSPQGDTQASTSTPTQHSSDVLNTAELALRGMGMLLTELLKSPDPQSPLKGEFGLRKQVAWSAPIAIKQVKEIGARYDAKVNDVLVAAITGALRFYLKQRGIDVDHTTLRALVPVDLRPPEREGQLGNEFGLVILDLAVNCADPVKRLTVTKERMDALKHSPEPMAMKLLFDGFGRGSKGLEDVASAVFGSKASLALTNVAGPREPLYLGGTAIDRMMFWVPHPGKELGMGISILSYLGQATLAVISDAHLVPDPTVITDQFQREFALLLHTANVSKGTTTPNGRRKRAQAPAKLSRR